MEEKVADLKLPDLKANFIVWVDDKPTEGL